MNTDILKIGQMTSKGKYVINLSTHEIWDFKVVLKDLEDGLKNWDNATKTFYIWDETGNKRTHKVLLGWSKAMEKGKKRVQLIIESIE